VKEFSSDFVWGSATASFQIEGASKEDGKGLSVWDMMCRWDGKVKDAHHGDVACDHYHRMEEDVQLIKDLGIPAYRFSVSWPRVLPEGIGKINTAGLDFYDRLVDELLDKDIAPYLTLFHWDYPLALFQRGGWLNPDSPKWFEDYTEVIVRKLGDRVKNWMTQNEPQCFLGLGHRLGVHAPGMQYDWSEYLRAVHHAFLAHGRSVRKIREYCPEAEIGWVVVASGKVPTDNSPEAIELARKAMFTPSKADFLNAAWFLDPVIKGEYPKAGLEAFGDAMPDFDDDDMAMMSPPIDYIGLNIYSGQVIESDGNGGWKNAKRPVGEPLTKFNWSVLPEVLYWSPKYIHERYQLPVMISENGLSCHDWVALDGQVHDQARVDFLNRYLRELKRACSDGVDCRGYFQWSLLDNFEWAEGYRERFGLVHVDYETQKRTPKDSAFWYRKMIASNGADL
jgi:beta-glucosidase